MKLRLQTFHHCTLNVYPFSLVKQGRLVYRNYRHTMQMNQINGILYIYMNYKSKLIGKYSVDLNKLHTFPLYLVIFAIQCKVFAFIHRQIIYN